MMKRILVLSIIFASGVVVLGCNKKPATVTPTPTGTWTVVQDTNTENSSGLSAQEIADLWAANAKEVDTLQVDVTMTNADGTSQGTMQILTDGKITKMVANSPEGIATIIYTSGASYMQMEGRNDWIKLPTSDQQPIQPVTFDANKLAEVWSKNADVKFLGAESCEVGKCDVYEGTDDAGTSKVYFGKKDNLLSKVVATQPDGTVATMLYTYDVEVNIEIPTNIQEFDIGSFQQGVSGEVQAQ